jgi:hypothetical protein
MAVVAAALLAPIAVARPADAGPTTNGTTSHLAAAAATIDDRSGEMPRTKRNEVTGDFLGRGYDQRAAVEGTPDNRRLNIYDSDDRGGALLRSTPADLNETNAQLVFRDEIRDAAVANGLNTMPLAWTPNALYMAGRHTDGENLIYRLPPDGSCAQLSCIPDTAAFGAEQFSSHLDGQPNSLIAPTALAVGNLGGTEVVALGLSNNRKGDWLDGGVGIYFIDPGSDLFSGPFNIVAPLGTNGGAIQTAVTGLDWDDRGSGLLAIATMQEIDGVRMQVARLGNNRWGGDFLWLKDQTYFDWTALPKPVPNALSTAVANRVDGSPVVAFGMDDGTVKLWDPALTSSSLLAQVAGSASAPVDALTFTDRIDGSVGVPDLVAVSSRGNSARVLRYSGATTLAPQPVAAGGGTTTDVGGIRAWFPGYRAREFAIDNDTGTTIEVDFATRPNASYGCYFSGVDSNYPAFPTDPVTLVPEDGRDLLSAFLTAGVGGDCAATDFTGQWAAYMVVTPLERPADRTVAKLVWSRGGQLSVQSVGGSLILNVSNANPPQFAAISAIDIQSPPAPGDPASLKVTGNRLDPAGTDQPVYRFDVPATTWPLPAATPARIQAVLRPLEVHGITAAGADVSLGLLVPQGQPTRVTSGSVTLSPVSFYWQNPDVGQQITDVYIQAGSTTSNRVDLAGLPSPAAGTPVAQLVACPATGSTTCDATADPFATGLDQAKLLIQVHDANNKVLPITDPAYGRIYYSDENGDLLTGLIPEDGSAYTRVSPYAGAFPNDGSSSTTVRPPTNGTVGGRYGYLSTTITDEQDITAHVGGSDATSDFTVAAQDFDPDITPGAQASQGFTLNGCADYRGSNACNIANITATKPGLFLTSDPDTGEVRIGLQFSTPAQTSLSSLPLQQLAGQPEHTVGSSPLTTTNGEAHLPTSAGFQPADTIDTWLVSHGAQVPLADIRVGGGN